MPAFEGNSIPQWARDKGAYIVEYFYVESNIEPDKYYTDLGIRDKEGNLITESFNDEEIKRIKQILPAREL
jgi:hypothetical protein